MLSTTLLGKTYAIGASVFITAVLAGQAYVTFAPVIGKGPGMRFWPIVSYAMYSRPHYEGETVEVYDLLEGTLSDGTVVEIPMESLGLGLWHYRLLVKDLKNEDPDAISILVDKFRWGAELAEVRIKSYPMMVTRNGPAEKVSDILYSLTLPRTDYADAAISVAKPQGAQQDE